MGAARDLMVLTGDHGNLVNFEEQAQFDTQGYACIIELPAGTAVNDWILFFLSSSRVTEL